MDRDTQLLVLVAAIISRDNWRRPMDEGIAQEVWKDATAILDAKPVDPQIERDRKAMRDYTEAQIART